MQAQSAGQEELPGTSSSSLSSNLDRYTSLLREQSQHVAQLSSSLDPLEDLSRLIGEADSRGLPSALHVGPLRPSRIAAGKRKCDDSPTTLQPASVDEAAAMMAALSSSIDTLAKALGLETFAEAHPIDTVKADSDEYELHTHTLTQGGRILVIDLDLGASKRQGMVLPLVKVRVSFAIDNSTAASNSMANSPPPKLSESGSHASKLSASDSSNSLHIKHAKLANALRQDLEDIAQLLFGLSQDGEGQTDGDMSTEERRMRQAVAAWQKLRKGLAALARIDQLSSSSASNGGKEPVNLFTYIRQLGEAVCHAASKQEDLPCGPISVTEAAPLTRILFSSQASKMPRLALDLSIDEYDRSEGGEQLQRDEQLGTLPSSQLSFVARLEPPLVLPRRLAARLGNIVGLAPTSTASLNSRRDDQDITALLGSSNGATKDPSSYDSLLCQQPGPSLPPSQSVSSQQVTLRPSLFHAGSPAILVSYFPFSTLRQLWEAVGVLQQGCALARLLRPVVMRCVDQEAAAAQTKQANQTTAEVTLDSLLRPPSGPTVMDLTLDDARHAASTGINLSSHLFDSKLGQMLHLSATIRYNVRKNEWKIQARVARDSFMLGGRGQGFVAKEMHEQRAADISAKLASSGDLTDACEDIVRWAKGEEAENGSLTTEPSGAVVGAEEEDAIMESVDVPASATAPCAAEEDATMASKGAEAAVATKEEAVPSAPKQEEEDAPLPSSSTAAHSKPARGSSPPSGRPILPRRRSSQRSADGTTGNDVANLRSPPPPLTMRGTSPPASSSSGKLASPTSPTTGMKRRGSRQGTGEDDAAAPRRSPTTRRNAVKREPDEPILGQQRQSSPTSGAGAGGPATRRRSQSSRGTGV